MHAMHMVSSLTHLECLCPASKASDLTDADRWICAYILALQEAVELLNSCHMLQRLSRLAAVL